MISALYAGLLALWLVILSFRVIAFRGNPIFKWFAFGYKDETSLNRAIRGHANLIEYAPIMLILLLIGEMTGAINALNLHLLGASFLIGRIAHGICFGFLEKNMALRIAGTVLTLTPLLIAACLLLSAYR